MSLPYKFGHLEGDAGCLGFPPCPISPIPHAFQVLGVHVSCRIGKCILLDGFKILTGRVFKIHHNNPDRRWKLLPTVSTMAAGNKYRGSSIQHFHRETLLL
jgi:hypothetical protein